MFGEGGFIYVYLIYGRYWTLNIVSGKSRNTRGGSDSWAQYYTRAWSIGSLLQLDKSFYGENLDSSERIWIEDSVLTGEIMAEPRIGVDYADDTWKKYAVTFCFDAK